VSGALGDLLVVVEVPPSGRKQSKENGAKATIGLSRKA
jgi:hypothetical protein